jgi:hypothetical protein
MFWGRPPQHHHPCHAVIQTPQPKASLDSIRPGACSTPDIPTDGKDPDLFASCDHVVDCDQCHDICLLWPRQDLCSSTTTHSNSRVDPSDPCPGRRHDRCPSGHEDVSSQDSQGKLSNNFLLDRGVSDRASVVALTKRLYASTPYIVYIN